MGSEGEREGDHGAHIPVEKERRERGTEGQPRRDEDGASEAAPSQ